jgi:hypothetical protein
VLAQTTGCQVLEGDVAQDKGTGTQNTLSSDSATKHLASLFDRFNSKKRGSKRRHAACLSTTCKRNLSNQDPGASFLGKSSLKVETEHIRTSMTNISSAEQDLISTV